MSSIRQLGPSFDHTRSAVLDMIRSSGTVSRIELAQLSGLTATTITRIVKSLIESGIVVEIGYGNSTGGKRPSLLRLNPEAGYAVGVSLDEARLTYVLTDLSGDVVGQLFTPGIEQQPPRTVVSRIADELEQLCAVLDVTMSDVLGVGVAGAGLDISSGAALSLTADGWDSFALAEALESLTGLPAIRENVSACSAVGQFWVGRIPATQEFATLFMAEGFGIGHITGGALSRGTSSNFGEVGHLIVDFNGPECWCGARGCLEILAAPRAVVAQAQADEALAAELGIVGGERHLRHDFDAIARAAVLGEERCLALVEQSARYVGAAMLSLVNLIDLERLYLAGPGFADAGPIYVEHINRYIALARTSSVHGVTVELADPGLDAAAVGAATLALQHVLTPHTRSVAFERAGRGATS